MEDAILAKVESMENARTMMNTLSTKKYRPSKAVHRWKATTLCGLRRPPPS